MNQKTNSRLEFPNELNVMPFTKIYYDREHLKAQELIKQG